MSSLWLLPGLVVVLGGVPVFVLARRTASEAARLRLELDRWGALQPAIVRVRTEGEALRDRLEETTRR